LFGAFYHWNRLSKRAMVLSLLKRQLQINWIQVREFIFISFAILAGTANITFEVN